MLPDLKLFSFYLVKVISEWIRKKKHDAVYLYIFFFYFISHEYWDANLLMSLLPQQKRERNF